jgi:Ca2+-binding RTX toxin-like protein
MRAGRFTCCWPRGREETVLTLLKNLFGDRPATPRPVALGLTLLESRENQSAWVASLYDTTRFPDVNLDDIVVWGDRNVRVFDAAWCNGVGIQTENYLTFIPLRRWDAKVVVFGTGWVDRIENDCAWRTMIAYGGNGDDWIYGGQGYDALHGEEGQDKLFGERGPDWLFGDNGHDFLIGGEQDDHVYGGNQNDWLEGNDGSDYLEGGEDVDYMFGDGWGIQVNGDYRNCNFTIAFPGTPGNDTLDGFEPVSTYDARGAVDLMYGGPGTDRFLNVKTERSMGGYFDFHETLYDVVADYNPWAWDYDRMW